MGDAAEQDAVRELLSSAVADAGHPWLRLSLFTVDLLDDDQIFDEVDGLDDLALTVPEGIRREAGLRRAALVVASTEVIE